jgi:putative colanic acid biosynthesis glycosyltransferase
MRILLINSVCGVGSTGRIVTDIHHELIADGHSSLIAYGRNEAKNCDTVYRIGSNTNIYADVFMTRVFDRHGSMGHKATRAFLQKIDDYQPDLVHLHNIHGYYVNIEILMDDLKQKNIPVVWTLHDCWSFTGHCAYFDYPKCERWRESCGHCPRKQDYPASFLMDRSSKNLAEKKRFFLGFENLTIVTPSHWLKDLVKQSFLGKYPIEVIQNGIDLGKFKAVDSRIRESLKLEEKKIVLGVAMIWDRRKGLEDMIKMSLVLGNDYQVVLIGLSKKQIQDLPPQIIGIQRTSSIEELAAYYSSAYVVAITSYEDNYPTVVLESLACHTQVVAYHTGGIPEMATSTYLHIVGKGDIAAMSEAIRNLTKVEWTMDYAYMDRKAAAKRTLSLYQDCLSQRRGTR